ncbi:MAG: DUF4125 family protein [Chloroflexi bacterium]|nr:DUF4125 family protein [Chloroflexota bacterium]
MVEQKMDKEATLKRIVEIELHMFERVKASQPSLCQERPEAFKTMRTMTHSALSAETLASYLDDLYRAMSEGKNLLTLKYARMEGKLVALKDNPLIEELVKTEQRWMAELAEKYPHVIKGGPGFAPYLSAELETYSDKTLDLYFRDVSNAEKEGRNLAEERYQFLFQKIGYGTLAEAEEKASKSKDGGV